MGWRSGFGLQIPDSDRSVSGATGQSPSIREQREPRKAAGMPPEPIDLPLLRGVSHPDGLVGARRIQPLSVGSEDQFGYPTPMPFQTTDIGTGERVVEVDGAVGIPVA